MSVFILSKSTKKVRKALGRNSTLAVLRKYCGDGIQADHNTEQ